MTYAGMVDAARNKYIFLPADAVEAKRRRNVAIMSLFKH